MDTGIGGNPMIDARISSVRMREVSAVLAAGSPHRAAPPQSRPLSIYPAFHTGSAGQVLLSDPHRRTARYLEIATTAGVTGRYGPLDHDVVAPLAEGMASGLLGLNPMANGYIWDVLQRTDRHSRHGTRKMAMSAVDNALWDLRGRLTGVPVWQLLGGAGRTRIPAYASTHGTFHSEGEVERTAEELLDEGYTAQKWFFGEGPAQGPEGMERNIALVERTRAAVGFRSALMFDAFMSWDLPYARAWCARVEHLRPDWLEEPFPAAAVPSFEQLRSSTTIPLAAGEHLYDRYDLLPFLRKGLLSVVQVDPEWCGGVTEVVRMCAMAEPFGVQVFPHGHGIHAALHIVASQSPQLCPSVEYLYRFTPEKHYFEVEPPAPKGGAIPLPTRPGFGIEIDEDRVETDKELFAFS
ncbi:hypothetical protein JK364_30225 [Streptomyces sp. 110]|uniref:Mandelate racemase/muconate lactonizing enzyme C-terminal domain-containing protein n=1 Tax=Streptomyces endocoffeicus TaxID=2898945 RepID=A0ABS1PW29_9ACTN|nr:enolase C-terminal domain-like protein [Streptomyces endocoffeicus]MBL1116637.1 hypothetical protein [Streptomyces endocoffeicus]